MKKAVVVVLSVVLLVMGLKSAATAGEIDVLVQKLVDKKLLTKNEAKIIMEDTKEDVVKQNASGKNEMLPKWVQTMKWNGDFRLRNEWRQNPGIVPNLAGDNRLRFRARVGFTSDINKETTFGFRLASGSATDATSTNQTMGTMFTSKYIGIDQAYLEYRPGWLVKNLKVIGGKMPNPLWTTDMIWDPDVTPEGLALKYEHPLTKDFKLFANLGGFVYNDLFGTTYAGSTIVPAETSAAYIVVPQAGFDYRVMENLSAKAALAYMNVSNLANNPVMTAQGGGPRGNTVYYKVPVADSNAYYKYGFDIINPTVQISTKA
ncbi:MAG TPA: putative porin, partial [bacterium]|nr:putative porin [bacterium]